MSDTVFVAQGPGRLYVHGELTMETFEDFGRQVRARLPRSGDIVLDLSNLRVLNGHGIHEIIKLALTTYGRRVRLVNVDPKFASKFREKFSSAVGIEIECAA